MNIGNKCPHSNMYMSPIGTYFYLKPNISIKEFAENIYCADTSYKYFFQYLHRLDGPALDAGLSKKYVIMGVPIELKDFNEAVDFYKEEGPEAFILRYKD